MAAVRTKTIARSLWLIVLLASCDSNDPPENIEKPNPKVIVDELYSGDNYAWEATIYDFNQDGTSDVLINGHNPASRIFYSHPAGYIESEFRFPRGRDRHACDAADVNLDGQVDLYCSVGVGRGRGANNNELWMGRKNGHFYKRLDDHGALDSYGRGRQVVFFNFNNDDFPDLYVTNWTGRADANLNENSVFINRGGVFERYQTVLSDNPGSRCIDAADINGDGYDDLLLCSKERQDLLSLNKSGKDFRIVKSGSKSIKRVAAKFVDLNNDEKLDLVVLGPKNVIEILFFRNNDNPYPMQDLTLPLNNIAAVLAEGDKAVDFDAADINHDGFMDIYIAMRQASIGDEEGGDSPDVILLGPDWGSSIEVPIASRGKAHRVYALGDKFLVLNAGESWAGSIDIISVDNNH